MLLHLALLITSALCAMAAPQKSEQQCVTTIGLPGGCCPPHSASSETVLVDCAGCSLTSVTTGIHCMMVCPTPAPTSPGTTTVTSCSPSGDAAPPATSILKTTPTQAPAFAACTKTITTSERPACTVTEPAHTVTHSSDCSCCDLTTTTLPPSIAVRCSNPVTTVFNRKKTKTETVCASSTSCGIFY